jgi:hypothetical protein
VALTAPLVLLVAYGQLVLLLVLIIGCASRGGGATWLGT